MNVLSSTTGDVVHWNVASDTVDALECFCNAPGQKELLVGCECSIKILNGSTVLWDLKEADRINLLTKLGKNSFAFSLNNGSIGV